MAPETPADPITRREAAIAIALLGAWWIGLALFDGAILLQRRFHLDELCCTVYAVREASNPLEVARLALRYDVAPPLLHLTLWPVAEIAGSLPPVLRSVPLASVALASILLFFLLRRRFGVAPSAAGVLAVLSNSLVITHAFEVRFYGLWLLFGCAFAWALGLDPGRPSRRRDVALAVLAACLCALHWFGVTSLVLLAAGAFLARLVTSSAPGVTASATGVTAGAAPAWSEAKGKELHFRAALRLVAPGIAGPILLLLLLPAMFRQLEHSGAALFWVPLLSFSQVMQMAQLFWIRLPIAVGFALLLVNRLFPRLTGHAQPTARVAEVLRDPAIAALVATLLMPVVLVFITLVLEPVMVPRYAIVAVLGAAPVVALAFELLGRVGRTALFAVFALFLVGFADREILGVRSTEASLADYDRQLREVHRLHPDIPLVFQSLPVLYGVDGDARQQSIGRILELGDSALDVLYPGGWFPAERVRLIRARRMARLHEEGYDFPKVITVEELQAAPRFVLFARDRELPLSHRDSAGFAKKLFPSHDARRISDVVTVYERAR
jgi:hypothetical protein